MGQHAAARSIARSRLTLAFEAYGEGGMVDENAIDPTAWGDYVRNGLSHFERVVRSFNVFARNAGELVELLRAVETDVLSSLRLMGSTSSGDDEAEQFRQEFWGRLDQRLHNMVSAAASVVDHTRPLVEFYCQDGDFQTSWEERNVVVATSPRAQFLRRLRNYLLHSGMAPTTQTMRLGAGKSAEDWDDLTIQLSAEGLLRYDGWNAGHRAFIQSFDGGPPLRRIAFEYAEDMASLYRWLFQQFPALHVAGVPPPHLYRKDETPDDD